MSIFDNLDKFLKLLIDAYDDFNSKPFVTYQSFEAIQFLSNESFYPICKYIVEEIAFLEEDENIKDCLVENFGYNEIIKFIKLREMLISSSIKKEDFDEYPSKLNIIYKLLIELLTSRLIYNKCLRHSIVIPELLLSENHLIVNELQNIEKNLINNRQLNSDTNTISNKQINSQKNINKLRLKEEQQIELLDQLLKIPLDKFTTPIYKLIEKDFANIYKNAKLLNEDYKLRQKAILSRFNVTIQSFLWPQRVKQYEKELCEILLNIEKWKLNIKFPSFFIYDILTVDRSLFESKKISSTNVIPSAIKKVTIGEVTDRGGIPEGYSMSEIQSNVNKANISLQQSSKTFTGENKNQQNYSKNQNYNQQQYNSQTQQHYHSHPQQQYNSHTQYNYRGHTHPRRPFSHRPSQSDYDRYVNTSRGGPYKRPR